MSKTRRKYGKLMLEKGLIADPQSEKAAGKKSRFRPYRIFTYRGITFFLAAKGENTLIYTLDKTTNQPELQLTVPKKEALKAAQALAKVAIAEHYLATIDMGAEELEED